MLDLGKVEDVTAECRERGVVVAVEDDQEKGEEETDNWDWEEEYLHFLCSPAPALHYTRQENNIGNCVEDKIGECIFGDQEVARVSGDQRQGEQGEEQAKDWDQD